MSHLQESREFAWHPLRYVPVDAALVERLKTLVAGAEVDLDRRRQGTLEGLAARMGRTRARRAMPAKVRHAGNGARFTAKHAAIDLRMRRLQAIISA